MIRVYTSSVIDASADTVWSRIRDFNGLPLWHPGIADSRIENGDAGDRVFQGGFDALKAHFGRK